DRVERAILGLMEPATQATSWKRPVEGVAGDQLGAKAVLAQQCRRHFELGCLFGIDGGAAASRPGGIAADAPEHLRFQQLLVCASELPERAGAAAPEGCAGARVA